MIDFKYADLFKQNSVDVQLEIISDDGKIHITNTEFHEEEFELTESLCSQSELTFGAIEAGSVKFKYFSSNERKMADRQNDDRRAHRSASFNRKIQRLFRYTDC